MSHCPEIPDTSLLEVDSLQVSITHNCSGLGHWQFSDPSDVVPQHVLRYVWFLFTVTRCLCTSVLSFTTLRSHCPGPLGGVVWSSDCHFYHSTIINKSSDGKRPSCSNRRCAHSPAHDFNGPCGCATEAMRWGNSTTCTMRTTGL